MKITTAILTSVLLLANAAISNAAIIVTTSFIPGTLTNTTASFTVRSTFSTSGATDNSAASYGFRVALTGATVSNIQAPIPPNAVGFIGSFTSDVVINSGSGFVEFIGRSGTNVSFVNSINSGLPNYREFTFDVTRPLSGSITLTATTSGIGYSGISSNLLGAAAGGNGFVVTPGNASNIGTAVPVASNFAAPANTSITAVPEPSSVAMLAIAGVLGFGVRMRSWKAKRKLASDNC